MPELASDVTPLSQLAESLNSVPRPPVGCVWFELNLTLLMSVGRAFPGAALSVGAWDVSAALLPSSIYVPPSLLVGMSG